MTPDGFSRLQVVNCTSVALFSGNGGSNQGFYNQYQMSSWFPELDAGTPLVAAQSCATFNLQFSRGVGDEDDGADMQINLGSGNAGANNIVWMQGRSNENSSHYNQAVVQQPAVAGLGPLIIASTASGTWPLQGPSGITFNARGQTAGLGLPDGDQCLAIIDLAVLFPVSLAQLLEHDILGSGLSSVDAANVWIAVTRWMGWSQMGAATAA